MPDIIIPDRNNRIPSDKLLIWLGKGNITGFVERILYNFDYLARSLAASLFCLMVIGIVGGLIAGFQYGGLTCIQHYVLRFFLWSRKDIPWNISRFLDHATERILLLKTASGYMFIHGLLREYIASLDRQNAFAQTEKLSQGGIFPDRDVSQSS